MISRDSTPMMPKQGSSSTVARFRCRSAIGLVVIAAALGPFAACRGKAVAARDTATEVVALALPTPADSSVAPATAGSVPPSIEAIGHHGENAYDMAKLGNWANARASADSLSQALDSIPGSAVAVGASREDVTTAYGELDLAISRKDRVAALRAANRLTELGAILSRAYQPAVPSEVTLLDYYGRELEIWAAAGDRARLRETASAIRRTWDAVRPQVEARGGNSEAVRFDALVGQVERAATLADYARVATPVLDAVDTLEQVFTR